MGWFSKKKRKRRSARSASRPTEEERRQRAAARAQRAAREDAVDTISVKPTVEYGKTGVEYVLEIANRGNNVFGDAVAQLYLPKELGKDGGPYSEELGMIQTGETKTVRFVLPVPEKPGKYPLECLVSFFDFASKSRVEGAAPKKILHVWSPKFKPLSIEEHEWRISITHMVGKEFETEEIPMGASKLFERATALLKAMHFYLLPEKVAPNLFRGIQHAYAEDSRHNEYAVQVQVIGDEQGSKMLVQTYAQTEIAVVGLYAKIVTVFDTKFKIRDHLV